MKDSTKLILVSAVLFFIGIGLLSIGSSSLVSSGTSKPFLKLALNETCYGVMLDAGSSSTKMNIYQWPCRDFVSLPSFNPKTIVSAKILPGISAFGENPSSVADYLQPLLTKARSVIPAGSYSETPIMFGATAGMRLLPMYQQEQILTETRKQLRTSGFFFKSDSWAKVITGQEEGVYLWIATNYLLGVIKNNTDIESAARTTTTLDLGGASTQISFQPRSNNSNSQYNYNVTIPENNDYSVYSVSYLGYGNDQARISVVNSQSTVNSTNVFSGCFNRGYNYTSPNNQTVVGTSDPQQCLQSIRKVLNVSESCETNTTSCSINSTFQPLVPSERKVVAVSGFHVAQQFYNLTEDFYAAELLQRSAQFCNLTYEQIQTVAPGNPYASTMCFLGLYSAALLIDGYKVGDHLISSPSYINGAEPAWAMGFAFDVVSNYKCDDSEVSACYYLKRIFGSQAVAFMRARF